MINGGGGGGVKHRLLKIKCNFLAIPSLRLYFEYDILYKYVSEKNFLLENKEEFKNIKLDFYIRQSQLIF